MARIRVLVDIRENELLRELTHYCDPSGASWWVEKTTLDVGDIAFVSDVSGANPYVVLERKTAEDLGASQRDGRYREQRARLYALRGRGTAIGYVVEAPPWSPSLNRTWCRGAFTEVNLQQTIARLMFRHTIPVFQSASTQQTVQWIRRIASVLVADPTTYACGMAKSAEEAAAAYTEAIHVKKAENNSPQRIFISFLLAIPGLGKATAEAIGAAVHYSFTTLQSKSLEELSDITGGKKRLGHTLASAIHAAIHS